MADAHAQAGKYYVPHESKWPIIASASFFTLLLAVPFARFSVESQAEIEKTKRRSSSRGGVFGEAGTEEGARIVEDDAE